MRFWGGSSVSTLGSQVTYLALPWLVLQLTHSPFQLGLVGALDMLAFPLFGLLVGVYADRWDRRVILLTADLVRFAVLASIPLAAALHVLTLAQIYVVAFIAGVGRVWFEVAHYSTIPDLVSRSLVVEGNSALEVTEGVSTLVGPSLGGALIKLFGAANAILADAFSFLIAVVAWFTLPSRVTSERPAEHGLLAQIAAGLTWIRYQRVVLENLLAAVALNITFAAVTTVFVFYTQHELHLDAARTGLLLGIAGVGPIITAVLAPWLRRRFRAGQLLIIDMVITGPLVLLLDIAPGLPAVMAFVVVAVALALAFGSGILARIVLRSYVQASAPPLLLARVNASLRVVAWGSVPVGALLGGTLTQLVGIRWTIALAGALCIGFSLWFAVASETKTI